MAGQCNIVSLTENSFSLLRTFRLCKLLLTFVISSDILSPNIKFENFALVFCENKNIEKSNYQLVKCI